MHILPGKIKIAVITFASFLSYPVFSDAYEAGNTEPHHSGEPAVPGALVTTEQLSSVASSCNDEINRIHELKTQIPRNMIQDYSIALGIAAEKCEALAGFFKKMQKASTDYEEYLRNLERAQLAAGSAGGVGGGLTSHHGDYTNIHEHSYPATQQPSHFESGHTSGITQEPLGPSQ